jgi:hypothetical protein
MAIIELTITKDYVHTWGIWEGIRELVQNAVDGEREFGYKMKVQMSTAKKLIIENQGGSLPRDALLFGYSTKRNRSDLSGQFGEGLKLGILALIRAGLCITIKNGGEIWKPVIEESKKFKQDVLKFKIRKNTKQYNSLRIEIRGINEETWNTCKAKFLFLNKDVTGQTKTRFGTLIEDERLKGYIFVKGIFVEYNGEFSYGYDLKDAEIDRDRGMVSSFDLRWRTGLILNEAMDRKPTVVKKVYDLLEVGGEDVSSLSSTLNRDNLQKVVKRFRKDHGKNSVPVVSLSESKEIGHLGKRGAVVAPALASVLSKEFGEFEEMKTRLRTKTFKPVSYGKLTKTQKVNLETSIEMVKNAGYNISLDLINVVEYKDKGMMGQWIGGKIRLAQWVLNDLAETLEVLVHEFCHSFGTDGEKAFHAKTEEVFAKVAVANMKKAIQAPVGQEKPQGGPTPAAELHERREIILNVLRSPNSSPNAIDVMAWTALEVAEEIKLDKKVVRRTLMSMAKRSIIYAERYTADQGGYTTQIYLFSIEGRDGQKGIHGEW